VCLLLEGLNTLPMKLQNVKARLQSGPSDKNLSVPSPATSPQAAASKADGKSACSGGGMRSGRGGATTAQGKAATPSPVRHASSSISDGDVVAELKQPGQNARNVADSNPRLSVASGKVRRETPVSPASRMARALVPIVAALLS